MGELKVQKVIFTAILFSLIFGSFEINSNDHTNGRGGRLGVRDAIPKVYQEFLISPISMYEA